MLTFIGNSILGIDITLYPYYWLMLFTVSCHANLIGLNISSAFNSAVTVYILIPLLLIPELILSGIIFDYEKLNNAISERGKVPIVADLMATRWAYEGIAVEQYKNNSYMKSLFEYEHLESSFDFKNSYLMTNLEDIANNIKYKLQYIAVDSIREEIQKDLVIIENEFMNDTILTKYHETVLFEIDQLNEKKIDKILKRIYTVKEIYLNKFLQVTTQKDSVLTILVNMAEQRGESLEDFKSNYINDRLSDVVRNLQNSDKIIVKDNHFLQLKDPIYFLDLNKDNPINYRSHFFAHKKLFLGIYFDTYYFNVSVIWFITIILFLLLYYNGLGKLVDTLSKKK